MTDLGDVPGTGTEDEAVLADLFDSFLQTILDGREPRLDSVLPDRPDLQPQIRQTWALACSVAGRREPGRPVLGGYEVLRELGHGGMGTVYLARHQDLRREVAIKVLPHSLALSPRSKQRFLEEARALARLRHEHVVHVHRILDHAEMLAFEMEYVAGPNLRSLIGALRQKAKPQAIGSLAEVLGLPVDALGARNTVEWFVRLVVKMARALGEVHRHGLVHRDVKPSNILLRPNGQPVLADFGLARDDDLEVTHASFAGTPVYAAPERLRSGDADVDARADVYSLAVTLYEALTLDPPFGGKTTHEVLRSIEEGRLPSLRKRAPHVPRDLAIVVQKAMEPDRRHRYETADAFADDLERLLSLQPIHARPVGPVRRGWKFLRRHHRIAMAAAGGAVLVAAAIWPVLAHARARADGERLATARRHDARTHLLCPENLYSSWSPARRNTAAQSLRVAAVRDAQRSELDKALASYDLALAATPDDAGIALERRAVHAVSQLLHQEGTGDPAAAIGPQQLAALPPLTAALVRDATDDDVQSTPDLELLATADAEDRFAAGLFAFLRNDHATSEACWRDLPTDAAGQAFVAACGALQMLGEGSGEDAFPRLFHAQHEFPRSTALAFAMADAAIATNDLELAERWLRAIPETEGSNVARSHRKRLATDMLAARGHYEEARRGYAELRAGDSSDPEPLLRLATLSLRTGLMREAESMLRELLWRWPGLAQPRLLTARIALQRHDLPAYLDQVRFVLAQDLGRMARGTAGQLADVLRIGGLHRVHAELCRHLDRVPGALRDDEVIPLTSWLSPGRVAGIVSALQLVERFDRNSTEAGRHELRPMVARLMATWRTLDDAPALVQLLGWPAVVALRTVLPPAAPTIAEWIEPLQLFQQALGRRMFANATPLLFRNDSASPQCFYGYQVLRVGDVDGDTLTDLCITAPAANGRDGGYIEFRSLGDGEVVDHWPCETPGHSFGRSVAPIGDVDGDLCTDLVVGAPLAIRRFGACATVSLRSGRTGNDLWVLEDDAPSFGAAVAVLADVDGDGCDDVAAGISPTSADPSDRGRVVVYSGRSGRPLYEVTADRGGVWFGGSVADAGDTNGDGVHDLLVGGNFGRSAGLVCLYDGRSGTLLSSFHEADMNLDFGGEVAGLGDVDGDGHADFLVCAPAISSAGREPGQVHVFSGRTGRTLYELRGDRPGDGFGARVCALPSYCRPGEPAIAVATLRGGPIGNGYVRIFLAADGQPVQTSAGGGALPFAIALVDLGDRDGDGFRDLGALARTPASAVLRILHYGQTPLDQRRTLR